MICLRFFSDVYDICFATSSDISSRRHKIEKSVGYDDAHGTTFMISDIFNIIINSSFCTLAARGMLGMAGGMLGMAGGMPDCRGMLGMAGGMPGVVGSIGDMALAAPGFFCPPPFLGCSWALLTAPGHFGPF